MKQFPARLLGQKGQSEMRVPVFGFGAAHLGELYGRISDADAHGAVQAAWDAGIRYFDTAPWYGHGLSEHRLGTVLRNQPRAEFVLSTKVGRVYHRPANPEQVSTAPWAGGLPFDLYYDYGRDGILRSYEQSLLRLGINRVDTLVIHDLDHGYHGDGEVFHAHWRALQLTGMDALLELRRSGEISAIGAGVNSVDMIAPMASALDVDFLLVAMPYTLLDQAALHDGFRKCAERNIKIVIGAPFASGLLATGAEAGAKYDYADAAPELLEKTRAIATICTTHGVDLPAAALRFVLAHPLVASVIPGAINAAQVQANVAYMKQSIPIAFWDELKSRGLLDAQAPTPKSAQLEWA